MTVIEATERKLRPWSDNAWVRRTVCVLTVIVSIDQMTYMLERPHLRVPYIRQCNEGGSESALV